jgi:hypothetical protein
MTRRDHSGSPATVLSSGDPALLAVAKSLLEDARIEYFAVGEIVQDWIGGGRLGTGFNPVVGPVRIQVAAEDAEEASSILRELVGEDAD